MYLNIETERLIIRPISIEHSKFIMRLVNTKGWLEFIGDRNVANQNDAVTYIQDLLENKTIFYHVFELKNSQITLGIVTLLIRENEKFPDIGFAILPEFEQKGYTWEASKAYLESLIKSDAFENIIAITKSNNQKSINLILKLGFTFERYHVKGDETLSYYSLKTGQDNIHVQG